MKTKSSFILIILATITAASMIGYYYAYSYVASLGEKKILTTFELGFVETKYKQALSLQAVANSGRDERQKLDTYIINKGEEISIVKNLEKLAESLSLSAVTENIDSQDDEALSPQGKDLLHIVITTNGTLQQNRRYLSLLEILPYNVRLNVVEMSEVDVVGGSKTWQGRFDIGIVKEKDTVSTQ